MTKHLQQKAILASATGVPVTADIILHTPFETLAASAAAAEEAGKDAPDPDAAEPMPIDGEQSPTEGDQASVPDASARAAAQKTILDRLLEELIHNSKPEVGAQPTRS